MNLKSNLLTGIFAGFTILQAHAASFDVPHISVYGTATTDIVPDLMEWQVNVRTTGKTVPTVAEAHDKNVALVLAFLKREEIDEKETQTSRLQLAEDVDYRGGTRVKKGYFASTTIAFESKTLEAYRELWTGLSKLEMVTIQGVSFDSSRRIEVRAQTRHQALQAAKEKASDMARTLDNKILGVLLIEEERSAGSDRVNLLSNRRMSRALSDESSSGPSLSVGTIPITERVRVVFQIVP